MKKITIKNKESQNIVMLIDEAKNTKGLAFIIHGLGGNKEQPHIITISEAFKQNGYTVVRFDTTNTFGESDGSYEHATITNYYEDLEAVIDWAKTQPWYREPFCLAGHSLGGIAITLYAEKYPDRIKGLAPVSTVVSGKLSLEAPQYKAAIEDWKRTGWYRKTDTKKLPWSHMEDRLAYDLLSDAKQLTMPVLLIVGENDSATPPEHQQKLYKRIPNKKQMHIIKGAPHTFAEQEHLIKVNQILHNWINELYTNK